jgi:hypothetical protein
MDRLLERFFGEPSAVERPVGMWTPRTNVTETKDRLTITAELPGLEAKDVDVAISGDMLTIKGEKKQEKEEKDEYHHVAAHLWGLLPDGAVASAGSRRQDQGQLQERGADGHVPENGGDQTERDPGPG